MKRYIIIVGLLLGIVSSCLFADPLIVAVLMVKNEEPVVVQTLEPLVEGGIDAFVIFDTGSTDATIKKATDYLESKDGKQFHIFQEPFVDFSTSRNRALDLAQEVFPDAQFMIMPDAEWLLQNVPELISFCTEHLTDTEPGYLVRIISNSTLDYYNCRLIRCASRLRFKCPVHEYIDYMAWSKVPETVFFAWNNSRYGHEKSVKRWLRDRDVLLKYYHEDPKDPRTVFYLAQTYACLNETEKACFFYKERIALGSWGEEAYVACYRLAEGIEHLADTKQGSYAWAEALHYYLKAHAMRSCRAEPLVKIATHYLVEGNHRLAFLFARRAAQIPYPKDDMLFVEKEFYTFDCYDILGQSSWYIGEYDVGEWAVRQALKNHRDRSHLHSNLSFYLHRNIASGKYGPRVISIPFDAESLQGPLMWSILICTITERKDQFDELIAQLTKQIHEQHLEKRVEIVVFSDAKGECSIGLKRNELMKASKGKYTNFIDDDDQVHPHYIKMIFDRLHSNADCVSLIGIRTENGEYPQYFYHSIDYDTYFMKENAFYRPPNHLNPIKREIAITVPFAEVSWGEDTPWALEIARSGKIKTEEVIQEPYYFYNYKTKDY